MNIKFQANNKWVARIEAQNKKIELEAKVLKMYCDDIKAAAERRTKLVLLYITI